MAIVLKLSTRPVINKDETQQTVLDEAKNPPKTFVTTKVYLTLRRVEATFSSYRGNVASARRVSLPKTSEQII